MTVYTGSATGMTLRSIRGPQSTFRVEILPYFPRKSTASRRPSTAFQDYSLYPRDLRQMLLLINIETRRPSIIVTERRGQKARDLSKLTHFRNQASMKKCPFEIKANSHQPLHHISIHKQHLLRYRNVVGRGELS